MWLQEEVGMVRPNREGYVVLVVVIVEWARSVVAVVGEEQDAGVGDGHAGGYQAIDAEQSDNAGVVDPPLTLCWRLSKEDGFGIVKQGITVLRF